MLPFKKIIVLCCLGLVCYTGMAQNNPPTIRDADSLYQLKLFKRSAKIYFNAFSKNSLRKTNANLFNAARASAKAHYPDSAYKFLFAVVRSNDSRFFDAINDEPDFKKLHRDKQWALLMTMIDSRKNVYNAPVANELAAMYKTRLALDLRMPGMLKRYGNNSTRFRVFRDSITKTDSINTLKLKSIINTYGWPGPEAIGHNGVHFLVFLFQKASFPVQKTYFPLTTIALKKGDINAVDYAVIADKISLFDTGTQIYGTQFSQTANNLLPVENKDSLNIRRHAIGLDTIPVFTRP